MASHISPAEAASRPADFEVQQLVTNGGRSLPKLPPADPWDKRTGLKQVTDFMVDCTWIPVNEDWATVRSLITLHDGVFALAKDAEVLRVYQDLQSGRAESPELSALAWTKRALSSGGVPVLGMYERNPGHMLHGKDGAQHFRWHATVGSRLSVAIVRLDGDLSGQVRLVPVE